MEQKKKCVLAVDDTPSYLMLLNMILQKIYAVKAAPKGETALKIVRQDPAAVDLILLDIMMDGMDGFTVCRELKTDPFTAHIPVIFISGREDEADRKQGLALGAADFIVKPFAADTVLTTVARHLPD
ncbi:response regulator [Candidatus Electronema sp. TJ]|uniref:response regulator n=1 Tax=Candidatus Electronema sp. TJ TaxID=3401573 RepID=UPI003AA7F015